ncbi:MAG: FtsX-like permease family protein, partial [Anaerovoracaceae bacterium]
ITASGPHINLQEFIEKEDNIRINNYAEDAKINKATAFMVGVFFMLLVAYILSVFAVQNIERERGVIGTLYSMGYRKKHALFSFISIPVVVVFVAAIFGTLVGYFLIHPLAGENTTAFSYPDIEKSYEPYVIIFTLIAPTVFTLIVNYFVINRRLKKPPLTLLRKQGSDGHMAKIDLGKMTFINRFRARQLLREIGVAITLVVGLFLAILIMALGFSTKGSIDYYIDQTAKETNYASMTLFKYPPASSYEGEKAYGRQLKIDYAATGGTADVTLLGIKENSKYFDFKVKKNKNQVYISSSAEKKLYLKKGDVIYLTDPVLKESYRFTVAGTVKYTNSLYMFMDMDKMQERFAKPNGYYNFLFSDKKGEIKDDSVKSVIKKKDVETATEQFVDLMSGTVNMLITLSILVMVITIYLLINLMIEKSAFSISLVKVLGYQRDVIRKIYLTPGGIIVFLATAISIPITKLIMNKLFPMLITNFASGMRVYIYPHMYLQMVLLIAVTYFVVNFALKRHLDRVPVTEILKNVE